MQKMDKNIQQKLKDYPKLNEALENILEKLYQDDLNINKELKNDANSIFKDENK